MEKQIQKFIHLVKESENIVFFGGAGVSTESGIPDFRSKDGLYNQHDVQFDQYEPEYLLSHSCLLEHPKVFFEFYRQKLNVEGIQPNVTHTVLAKLEQIGKLKGVITQNIDGLHQKAGSKHVVELHGTTLRNYCMCCKNQYPAQYIFESNQAIPRCNICGGIIRPDVVLYEEGLSDYSVNEAIRLLREADLLIVAGTSLKVYPAANFVYQFSGSHLAVINKEPLKMQLGTDDVELICGMGDVFCALDKEI